MSDFRFDLKNYLQGEKFVVYEAIYDMVYLQQLLDELIKSGNVTRMAFKSRTLKVLKK